ncbi:hypothetical protein, partial [Flavobacterium frigoris]
MYNNNLKDLVNTIDS